MGREGQKLDLLCILNQFVCGPDKFILSVKSSFSISGKWSFLGRCCFCSFLLGVIFYPLRIWNWFKS